MDPVVFGFENVHGLGFGLFWGRCSCKMMGFLRATDAFRIACIVVLDVLVEKSGEGL